MSYPTYKDFCINVLLKMGEDKNIVNGNITQTNAIKGYLKAMPSLLAESLNLLATAGKYIVRERHIVINPIDNLLGGTNTGGELFRANGRLGTGYSAGGAIYSVNRAGITLSAPGAKAFYLEVAGDGDVTISVGGVVQRTINNTSSDFSVYKGTLTGSGKVEIAFAYTDTQYLYRNVALYDQSFADDASVYDNVDLVCFDLRNDLTDFYKLNDADLTTDDGTENIGYGRHANYFWQGDSKLFLNNRRAASYVLSYFAYPQSIPADIADTTEIVVDPEVYSVLPLYVEGKLRMINDEDYALTVLNEFEGRRAELMSSNSAPTFTASVTYDEDVVIW